MRGRARAGAIFLFILPGVVDSSAVLLLLIRAFVSIGFGGGARSRAVCDDGEPVIIRGFWKLLLAGELVFLQATVSLYRYSCSLAS